MPSTASLKAEVERHLVGRVDEIAPKHLQACFDAARGALPLLARSIEHRLVQERRQKAEAKDMASGHDEDCPGPA